MNVLRPLRDVGPSPEFWMGSATGILVFYVVLVGAPSVRPIFVFFIAMLSSVFFYVIALRNAESDRPKYVVLDDVEVFTNAEKELVDRLSRSDPAALDELALENDRVEAILEATIVDAFDESAERAAEVRKRRGDA